MGGKDKRCGSRSVVDLPKYSFFLKISSRAMEGGRPTAGNVCVYVCVYVCVCGMCVCMCVCVQKEKRDYEKKREQGRRRSP